MACAQTLFQRYFCRKSLVTGRLEVGAFRFFFHAWRPIPAAHVRVPFRCAPVVCRAGVPLPCRQGGGVAETYSSRHDRRAARDAHHVEVAKRELSLPCAPPRQQVALLTHDDAPSPPLTLHATRPFHDSGADRANMETPLDTMSDEYHFMKDEIITAERRVLKELGFCVHLNHPHKLIISFQKLLGLERHKV